MTVGLGLPDVSYAVDSALLSTPVAPRQRENYDDTTGIAGIVSCVLDASPRFYMEALRWFAGLTELAGVEARDLRVGVVGNLRTDVVDYLRSRDVVVSKVPAFDDRSPHCNKIANALALAAQEPSGPCVLTDSDVVFLEDPRSLEIPDGHVAMKPVDAPNPPLEVLRNVFAAARRPEPELVALPAIDGTSTFAGNGNGGLYVIPGEWLTPVTQAWSYWAAWLLDRRELLDQWAVHVDQVAMALALAAEEIPVHHLAPRWNVPTHAAELLPRQIGRPAMVHYHQAVDNIAQITPTGVPEVDDVIKESNAATASIWQEAFPNATFWDWRYATNPDLGSGVGSRGEALSDKRELLTRVVETIRPGSVLDVGCGDGEATRELALPNYVGIDLSSEAVLRASAGRPDSTYHVGSLHDHPTTADLVFCLDVTIHLADPGVYESLVEKLLSSAGRALLIAGYETPSTSGSPMVYFHEPLSQTILRHRPDAELYPLRYDHEVWTFPYCCRLRPAIPGTTRRRACTTWLPAIRVRSGSPTYG
jgi:SAM-dependent methyltransferase